MALQKQTVDIPLGVGIDTITDPKQVQPGKLALLENGVFNKAGLVTPRFGLTSVTQALSGGGSVTSAEQISSYDDELVLNTGDSTLALSDAANAWVRKGASSTVGIKSRLLSRPSQTAYRYFDVAVGGGYECYIAATLEGGSPNVVDAWLVDATTQQPVFYERIATSSSITYSAKVVFANNRFFVYFNTTTGIDRVRVRVLDLANISARFSAAASADPGIASSIRRHFTVAFVNNALVLMFTNTVVGPGNPEDVYFVQCSQTTGIATGGSTLIGSVASPNRARFLQIVPNITGTANDAIYFTYVITPASLPSVSSSNIRFRVYDTSFVAVGPETQVVSTGMLYPAYGANAPNSIYAVGYEQLSTTAPISGNLTRIELFRNGTFGAPSILLRNATPASNMTKVGARNLFVANVESATQPTYLLLDAADISSAPSADRVVSSFSGNEATSGVYEVASFPSVSSDSLIFCGGRLARVLSTSATTPTLAAGPQSTRITVGPASGFSVSRFGLTNYRPSGTLWSYDGLQAVETGFRCSPDAITATAGGVGSLSTGNYQVAVIYEWTDARGQIHRSAPAFSSSVSVTAGQALSVNARNALFTNKTGVTAVYFRTLANGTTFYRDTTIAADSAALLPVTLNAADTGIDDNEILYTTGGVLENIAPPPANFAFTYNNRIFLLDCEDPNVVWYSRSYVIDECASFNDALTLRIDDGAGRVVAGGVIDDKLVFFKRNSIYVTAGDGPTDTGTQNDIRQPQLVSAELGCSEPLSVVRVPMGIMFKSSKGFYLLDRGLNLTYIGAAVDQFNGLEVAAAVLVDERNQVRFIHKNGVCLVYDWFFEQWSSLTNYSAQSGTIWKRRVAVVSSAGLVRREDVSSYRDDGLNVPLKLVTPWLKADSLQGFQRVYEAAFLGENLSPHTFQVRIGYDYDEAYAQTLTLSSTVFTGAVEQIKVRPARQKCQAIRFEVTKLNPGDAAGAGLTLSGLAVTVGVKGNINRTRVAQVAT